MPVLQRRSIPETIASLSGLDRVDYADLFTAPVPGGSAEHLARAALEHARFIRVFGPLVWQVALGLRLDRSAPGRIAGWIVGGRGDTWVRLESASWFMTAHVLVHVEEG